MIRLTNLVLCTAEHVDLGQALHKCAGRRIIAQRQIVRLRAQQVRNLLVVDFQEAAPAGVHRAVLLLYNEELISTIMLIHVGQKKCMSVFLRYCNLKAALRPQ